MDALGHLDVCVISVRQFVAVGQAQSYFLSPGFALRASSTRGIASALAAVNIPNAFR